MQEQLLSYLETVDNPITTRQLALRLGVSWHTIQHYCLELHAKKKIGQFSSSGFYYWTKKAVHQENKDNVIENERKKLISILENELDKEIDVEIDAEIETLLREIEELKQRKLKRETGKSTPPSSIVSEKERVSDEK